MEENEEEFRNRIVKNLSDIKSQISDVRKDIQYAVAPNFIEISPEVDDLIEFAIELWRMEHRINKILALLPENQVEVFNNSFQKLKRYLDKNDIEVIEYTNQKYDEGQNLDVLDVERSTSVQEPIIKETREPTILLKGQVVRRGKVIILAGEEKQAPVDGNE